MQHERDLCDNSGASFSLCKVTFHVTLPAATH